MVNSDLRFSACRQTQAERLRSRDAALLLLRCWGKVQISKGLDGEGSKGPRVHTSLFFDIARVLSC